MNYLHNTRYNDTVLPHKCHTCIFSPYAYSEDEWVQIVMKKDDLVNSLDLYTVKTD